MAFKLDSLRSSHPIQVPIVHAEEVEEVFDGISYCKGSAIISMINKVLGAENFRKGLQLYFQRHAYQNTETVDLWYNLQLITCIYDMKECTILNWTYFFYYHNHHNHHHCHHHHHHHHHYHYHYHHCHYHHHHHCYPYRYNFHFI